MPISQSDPRQRTGPNDLVSGLTSATPPPGSSPRPTRTRQRAPPSRQRHGQGGRAAGARGGREGRGARSPSRGGRTAARSAARAAHAGPSRSGTDWPAGLAGPRPAPPRVPPPPRPLARRPGPAASAGTCRRRAPRPDPLAPPLGARCAPGGELGLPLRAKRTGPGRRGRPAASAPSRSAPNSSHGLTGFSSLSAVNVEEESPLRRESVMAQSRGWPRNLCKRPSWAQAANAAGQQPISVVGSLLLWRPQAGTGALMCSAREAARWAAQSQQQVRSRAFGVRHMRCSPATYPLRGHPAPDWARSGLVGADWRCPVLVSAPSRPFV